jgi:hypothetical protein
MITAGSIWRKNRPERPCTSHGFLSRKIHNFLIDFVNEREYFIEYKLEFHTFAESYVKNGGTNMAGGCLLLPGVNSGAGQEGSSQFLIRQLTP